jgi:hypothetical protein
VEGWRDGVLPETKFSHFRQDGLAGSFNPNHHARWTAHEYLHRVVGFAWAPGWTPLEHATAARLAETLPVALWYFLEEATLRRCPAHEGPTAAWTLDCPRCAEAALEGPLDAPRQQHVDLARDFVRREIEAARATLRTGNVVPHRWATLDLASDGLAYVGAHGPRLASAAAARIVPAFLRDGQGWHARHEGLIARIEAVLDDLCGGAPAAPVAPDAARWRAVDVAWRLAQVAEDCDEYTAASLWAAIDALGATHDVAAAADAYAALHEEVELPEPEDVFAVGYDLLAPGDPARARHPLLGRAPRQLAEGVRSACPRALAALARTLGKAGLDIHLRAFAASDALRRVPLGHRFAAHLATLAATDPSLAEAADLARVEATVAHLPAVDPGVRTLCTAPPHDLAATRLAPWAARLGAPRPVLVATGLLPRGRRGADTTRAEVLLVRDLEGVGVLEVPADSPADDVPRAMWGEAWAAGARTV